MARCPQCSAEVADTVRFCPNCGATQPRRSPPEQPPLPFSPWGPPPMAAQPAGGGAVRSEPVVGPPLTGKQVTVAVSVILLFLLFVIFYVGGGFPRGGNARNANRTAPLPVTGIMGEAMTIGRTVWGVAFMDTVTEMHGQQPVRGQFLVVGVVIGNKGTQSLTLNAGTATLGDGGAELFYTPAMTLWGTPEELDAGQRRAEYVLPPHETIAGLLVFDVPPDVGHPLLLVRDLTARSRQATEAIDLTKTAAR